MHGSNEVRRVLSRLGCDLAASGLFVYGATLFFLPPTSVSAESSFQQQELRRQQRTSSLYTQCESNPRQSKLIFLGTGSSTGCPRPLCSLLFQDKRPQSNEEDEELQTLQDQFQRYCRVSNIAIQGDPRKNKNYRNNPSLLIHHYEHGGPVAKNVIIDVGKTFRETALRWLPLHGVRSLDAVILTHHHMDAVAGLDDLRGFQSFRKRRRESDGMDMPPERIAMPVFLSRECLDQVSSQFPWLFPKQKALKPVDSTTPEVKRDVAALEVNVVDDYSPFHAAGLKVTPLPVWHGDDLISLGFCFSVRNKDDTPTNVVYISDVSRMVPETLNFILERLPPTDILVVDALLNGDTTHPVHFSLTQAKALSRQIGAKQTYLVGMSCDSFPPHEEMNRILAEQDDFNIQLAHDGLSIEV
uniref:Metallo-beta-lactamase domain-containing protein n=1 Tax=Grammatophora oceanica TaxID=210454 RepID=A0A7S1UYI7_9STRA|mmetsp:Transcript_29520/g.43542  ORF Transcript_29520/g.43542 Transcript_29520/m.43542 type:complete len:413 (+) Transcript_29520:94-1332(+)|eukprot:CAMPEP_0194047664 /NCGR_PEP_ID=MMETSP0009_2-20130614/25102_1 /TAXON_ID=210454 /ORGANISM="Grammatophora oceanica, Strain CCMP 410" /LENGTH=412 /DNA_ID=CAMNT_0038693337 /DNA_START=65 /DNA_END=1303 /DNA_ORIENTATION=-